MIPVILSGGSGTRLWPVSRENYPKQFCEFYDHSFLENSVARLEGFSSPYILTVESMRSLTLKLMNDKQMDESQAIYEPMGKNTGPAVALLCQVMAEKGFGQEVVGVFPSDHLITDADEFRSVVALGEKAAQEGQVVTLGIEPRYAATGFGYIEVKKDVFCDDGQGRTAFQVEGFREKPDKATAEKFRSSGQHYWNAGMFLFRVDVMIEHFKTLLPDVWEHIAKIKPDMSNAKFCYANVESISIDYGIMEKVADQVCIPCRLGWSDVGSWDEISRLVDEIPDLKVESQAKVFNANAHSNYVFSVKDKVVGMIGVDDVIVVDTPDALLVTRKGQSQKVKEVVKQIKAQGLPQASDHIFEKRPWGGFEVLSNANEFKAKTITVDPGQKLSYQSHSQRSEHWIVIKGQAEVVLNDDVRSLKAGDYIQIPQGAKHRIGNPGTEPLIFVEVQTGSYFGEDDIVRYEDDYARV